MHNHSRLNGWHRTVATYAIKTRHATCECILYTVYSRDHVSEPKSIYSNTLYTTAQYMNDSTMNFETNIPTWNYILRMNGLVHDVFITQSTQECENKKLRKLKITSGVQGLCKLQIPEHLRESWKKKKNPENSRKIDSDTWAFIHIPDLL